MQFSCQDQNDDDGEMTTPPEKRKRGRPPKIRVTDRDSGGGTEESEEIGVKKKRRRQAKDDDEFLSPYGSSELLLLDLDEIAPLGLTRQASKELALVSLRKKQEFTPVANPSSEIRTASENTSSNTKQESNGDSEANDTSNDDPSTVFSEQDSLEVIEISSQSTDDERENLSQDSEPAIMKDCIVISSQSESESEGENLKLKPSLEPGKTKLKNKKEQSNTQGAEKDRVGKAENNLGKKKGTFMMKESLSAENQSETKKNNSDSIVDNFPPIDFSIESRTGVPQGGVDNGSPSQSSNSLEEFEMESSKALDEPAQETDVNSNQVTLSRIRPDLPSKLSLSKMQRLRKTMKGKDPVAGSLHNNNHKKSTDFSSASGSNENLNKTDDTSSLETALRGSLAENNVTESKRGNNDVENSSSRTSVDGDTSQVYNQGSRAMKRRGDVRKLMKGKAKRTEGRPKSKREFKKPFSTDKTSSIQPNSNGAEYATGPMNDTQGKTDKHSIASTTAADLLPMQNKTKSIPLMDGDLIGAIIQESGKDDDSKIKPVTATKSAKTDGRNLENGKTHNIAQGDTENVRSWVSFLQTIKKHFIFVYYFISNTCKFCHFIKFNTIALLIVQF